MYSEGCIIFEDVFFANCVTQFAIILKNRYQSQKYVDIPDFDFYKYFTFNRIVEMQFSSRDKVFINNETEFAKKHSL